MSSGNIDQKSAAIFPFIKQKVQKMANYIGIFFHIICIELFANNYLQTFCE